MVDISQSKRFLEQEIKLAETYKNQLNIFPNSHTMWEARQRHLTWVLQHLTDLEQRVATLEEDILQYSLAEAFCD